MAARNLAMVAYDGGVLNLPDYSSRVVLDLTGLKWMSDRLPIQAGEGKDIFTTIGQTTRLINNGRTVTMEGFVSLSAKNGSAFAHQSAPDATMSVILLEAADYVPIGRTITINQQTFTGPLFVAARCKVSGFKLKVPE